MNILIVGIARKNMTTSIDNDLQKEAKKLAIDLEGHLMISSKKLFATYQIKYENKSK